MTSPIPGKRRYNTVAGHESAIRGNKETLICDCTVVILFAGFFIESNINYIVEEINMKQKNREIKLRILSLNFSILLQRMVMGFHWLDCGELYVT